jgi:hypothetical protein
MQPPSFVYFLFSRYDTVSGPAGHRSCGGPGKAPVFSEKAAWLLLNLEPLRLFAERKRASKGTMSCRPGCRFITFVLVYNIRSEL